MKCKWCQKPFKKKDWRQKYCTKKCSKKGAYFLNKIRASKYYWSRRNPEITPRIFDPIPCKKCGKVRKHKALGFCKNCYGNWWENITRYGGKKEIIYERDWFQCQDCGMTMDESIARWGKKLVIHHVDSNIQNVKDNNLITLCNSCHPRRHHKSRRV